MRATITNVYDNDALKEPLKFKKGHGNAFLIDLDGRKIIFDTGDNGKKFLDNLSLVGVSPEGVAMVILSHGHYDHTTGLIALVDARPAGTVLDIIAHPAVFEPKGSAKGSGTPGTSSPVSPGSPGSPGVPPPSGSPGTPGAASIHDIGFPPRPASFGEKTRVAGVTASTAIAPGLHVLGEITARPEQDGTGGMVHQVDGSWVPDPLLDDTSLVFTTTGGYVLLAGCCHAGLLNTLAHVHRVLGKGPVAAVIGGTHMMGFTAGDVARVADVLERDHGTPALYLNHCTGPKAIEQLRARFGEKVHPFPAGASISLDLVASPPGGAR